MRAVGGSTVRVGVLTNLKAGRSAVRTARILRELSRHDDVLRRETSSNRMVPEAVAEFASEGVELLVLNGGDGTVHRALTEIFAGPHQDWRPLIAPLRCGRTNMIAADLGMQRSPARAMRALFAAAREGRLGERSVEKPVLRLDLEGDDEPKYGMFFGAGVLHRAIQLTHRSFPNGRAQGVFGAAVVTATLLARTIAGDHKGVLDPDKMQIAFDGANVSTEEFVVVMATTLDRLILGLRPFWGREDAPLRVTTLASGAPGLALALPRLVRGLAPRATTQKNGFASRNAHEVALRLDCGLTLDGELFDPEPGRVVRVSGGERVRFVRA